MGNTDSLPVISQAKSAVQAIAGDTEGARQTQLNFVKGCPVISQGVALGALIAGDTEYAKETQIYFVKNASNVIDSVPVVGHIKGAIHYACNDREGGDNAMKAASRTVGVAAGGIGGFVVGGPIGAVAGGIGGGAVMDGIISGADSAIHGEKRLYGHINSLDRAIDGKITAGEAFDWALTPVFDGLTGYGYGRAYRNLTANRAEYNQLKKTIRQAIEEGKLELKDGQTAGDLARQIQQAARELKKAVTDAGPQKVTKTTGTMIIDVEGNVHTGYSFRLRQALNIDAFEGGPSTTEQILNEQYPGRVPKIRGAAAGQPQCAEHHALHQFHRANGNHAVPKMTITIQYDGTNFQAIPRCDNCMKIGKSIPMGNVVTDALDGTNIPVENIINKACLDALMAECIDLCDCDNPHEHDE
ncbi:unnamed protein product [Rotaria sp. Silwood2]|nr:unnamed protein product [Rotaria sp. Silwood2]CAF4621385.1 unnamed protein product [Rotaria sp. Silwood2]